MPSKRTPNTGSIVGPVRNNLDQTERERDKKDPRDLRGRERESSGVKSERSGGSGRGTEGLDIKGKTNTLNLWSIGRCARREMENKAFKAI